MYRKVDELKRQKQRSQDRLLLFVTTYRPGIQDLKNTLMANYNLIENQPLLKTIFKRPAIISIPKTMLVREKRNLKAFDNATQSPSRSVFDVLSAMAM